MIAHGDKKRPLAEYEFIAALVEQSSKRGLDPTFLVADRRHADAEPAQRQASQHEINVSGLSAASSSAGLGLSSGGGGGVGGGGGGEAVLSPGRSSEAVVRGPFWNVMQVYGVAGCY
jgi:hypothetical protein